MKPLNDSQPSQLTLKTALIALMCAGGLALALVASTYWVGGSGLAARAATDLVMPIGAIWLMTFSGFVAGLLTRDWRTLATFLTLFLLIAVLFNVSVAGQFMQSVELSSAADPVQSLQQPLDAVVVLGGYIGVNRFGVAELGCSGQRLVLAAQMMHSGNAKHVICTGTGAPGVQHQSTLGKRMLISLGIDPERIFEVGGENTIGEMSALKDFFDSPPSQIKESRKDPDTADESIQVGLITSAWHMPRALRLAESKGLSFQPIACSFRGDGEGDFSGRDLIPRADAGRMFALAMKEKLARIVGR